MAAFGNPDQGMHKALIAFLLFCCFGGWCLQLGGVASLQAACDDNIPLPDNDIANLRKFIRGVAAKQIAPTSPQAFLGIVGGLRTLAARSTRVFTLTPDVECSQYYRYQWGNTALQFVPIFIMVVALARGALSMSRVAIVSVLAVATVMAIENAHTFYYVRNFAPDLSLKRGKVFAGGCIITAATNLALCIALGIQNEISIYRAQNSDGELHSTTKTKLQEQAMAA